MTNLFHLSANRTLLLDLWLAGVTGRDFLTAAYLEKRRGDLWTRTLLALFLGLVSAMGYLNYCWVNSRLLHVVPWIVVLCIAFLCHQLRRFLWLNGSQSALVAIRRIHDQWRSSSEPGRVLRETSSAISSTVQFGILVVFVIIAFCCLWLGIDTLSNSNAVLWKALRRPIFTDWMVEWVSFTIVLAELIVIRHFRKLIDATLTIEFESALHLANEHFDSSAQRHLGRVPAAEE